MGQDPDLTQTLVSLMRSGCTDAEQVQKYCSVGVCNVMTTFLSKDNILQMIENGMVQDLVVISVLRVNNISTKVVLGKALFNLLGRKDTREVLCDNDAMEAIVRLGASHPSLQLIAGKTIYNLSCEIDTYVDHLVSVDAINILVNQSIKSGIPEKLREYIGKSLVNFSFNPTCREMMLSLKISECVYSVSTSKGEDCDLHCAIIMYNLSKDENIVNVTNSMVIPLLVSMAKKGSVQVKQLVVATFVNMGHYQEFYEQLTENSLSLLIDVVNTGHFTYQLRYDATQALLNIIAGYAPSRGACLRKDLISSLNTFFKLIQDEDDKIIISRILFEISEDELCCPLIIVTNGLPLLLRLAKVENASIKLDVAQALLSLSRCGNELEVVENGVMDMLFWLTLQDAMNLNTSIYQRVARTMKNLVLHHVARRKIVLEDKFMTVLRRCVSYSNGDVKFISAAIFYNLMNDGISREVMVTEPGLVELLLGLGHEGDETTHHLVSATLHCLPSDLVMRQDESIIKTLMSLLDINESTLTEASALNESPHDSQPPPTHPQTTIYPFPEADLEPDWLEELVEDHEFVQDDNEKSPVVATNLNIDPVLHGVARLSTAGKIVGDFQKLQSGFPNRIDLDNDEVMDPSRPSTSLTTPGTPMDQLKTQREYEEKDEEKVEEEEYEEKEDDETEGNESHCDGVDMWVSDELDEEERGENEEEKDNENEMFNNDQLSPIRYLPHQQNESATSLIMGEGEEFDLSIDQDPVPPPDKDMQFQTETPHLPPIHLNTSSSATDLVQQNRSIGRLSGTTPLFPSTFSQSPVTHVPSLPPPSLQVEDRRTKSKKPMKRVSTRRGRKKKVVPPPSPSLLQYKSREEQLSIDYSTLLHEVRKSQRKRHQEA